VHVAVSGDWQGNTSRQWRRVVHVKFRWDNHKGQLPFARTRAKKSDERARNLSALLKTSPLRHLFPCLRLRPEDIGDGLSTSFEFHFVFEEILQLRAGRGGSNVASAASRYPEGARCSRCEHWSYLEVVPCKSNRLLSCTHAIESFTAADMTHGTPQLLLREVCRPKGIVGRRGWVGRNEFLERGALFPFRKSTPIFSPGYRSSAHQRSQRFVAVAHRSCARDRDHGGRASCLGVAALPLHFRVRSRVREYRVRNLAKSEAASIVSSGAH